MIGRISMKISKPFLSLFLTLFALSYCNWVFAVASDSSDLKLLLQPISSLQGSFQQTVKSEKGRVLQRYSGKVSLKKPGQFRWEVLGREQRLIVADGNTVWDFDKDLDQVTVQKLDKGQTRAPIYFLTGDVSSLDKDFTIRKLSSKNGTCLQGSDTCFELKPKREEGSFQWIRLGFKAKILNEMQVLDQLGQLSDFIFKDVQLNKDIPVSQFRFTPPKGVDVLQNE